MLTNLIKFLVFGENMWTLHSQVPTKGKAQKTISVDSMVCQTPTTVVYLSPEDLFPRAISAYPSHPNPKLQS